MFVFLGWDRRSGRNIGSEKIKVCNFNKFPPFNEGGFWYEPCSWILWQLNFLIARSKVSWDQKFHETKNLGDHWCYFWFDFYDILVKKITTTILSFDFFFSHNNNILIEEFLCIVFFFFGNKLNWIPDSNSVWPKLGFGFGLEPKTEVVEFRFRYHLFD